jgi:hypothetical protein
MALSHLLDTSVLTRLRHSSVRKVVEPLVANGLAARARISDLEIGYAARNEEEWDQLLQALNVMVPVDTTEQHVRRALQVQRMLAARSQRGRKIPDLLVAAAAEEKGFAVLHYDRDFDLVSSVTGQRCEWVVPPGSID